MIDQVTDYARGRRGRRDRRRPYVRAACQRHLADLDRGAERGLAWDLAAATRVLEFFAEVLTVEVEERDDYGQVRADRFPSCCSPGKRSSSGRSSAGKTRSASVAFGGPMSRSPRATASRRSPPASAIYMLCALGKVRAEVYSAATDRDQADILFRDAVSMWERSRALTPPAPGASGDKKITQLANIDP